MERVVLFEGLLINLNLLYKLDHNFLFLLVLILSIVKIEKEEIFLCQNQTNLLNLNPYHFVQISLIKIILLFKPTLKCPMYQPILLGLHYCISKPLLEAYLLDLTFLLLRFIGRHLLYKKINKLN